MLDKLRELCALDGVSGREGAVRDYIIERLRGRAEVTVDPLGNVLAHVKGRKNAKNKLMVCAHMDEVGFFVRYISDDGSLLISPVGGIDAKVIAGRRVTVNGCNGVIGLKPIHLCQGDEKEKPLKIDKLCIDIGAKSRQEAEKHIRIGDSVCFKSDFVSFGDGLIKAKAIDDRFGCAVMLEMIDAVPEYDMDFAFLVQEEIGLRGSRVAAFTLAPDFAIVLESTTAGDIAFVSGAERVCCIGQGAVISFMDRTTVYDRELFELAFSLANEHGIPCQTKTAVAGGNDAGSIHVSRGGVRTLTVSLPCRYIHSASSVAAVKDMQSVLEIAKLLSRTLASC